LTAVVGEVGGCAISGRAAFCVGGAGHDCAVAESCEPRRFVSATGEADDTLACVRRLDTLLTDGLEAFDTGDADLALAIVYMALQVGYGTVGRVFASKHWHCGRARDEVGPRANRYQDVAESQGCRSLGPKS
jgi:hypothetical protein